MSLGALLGKLNPIQVLGLSILESMVFTANAFLGYKVLGAVDIGKKSGAGGKHTVCGARGPKKF